MSKTTRVDQAEILLTKHLKDGMLKNSSRSPSAQEEKYFQEHEARLREKQRQKHSKKDQK